MLDKDSVWIRECVCALKKKREWTCTFQLCVISHGVTLVVAADSFVKTTLV